MKILVPNDFSVPGILASRFATDLALSRDGEVLVMKTAESFLTPELVYTEDDNVSAFLNKRYWNRRYWEHEMLFDEYIGKQSLNLVIERGPITIIIPSQDLVEEQQIDLVVAGTNGDFISPEFIGIDSAVRFGSSTVPVITLRKGVRSGTIKDIVLPITMRTDQTDFVLRARALQEMYDARLHLLLVKKESFNPSDIKANYFVDAFARHYRLSNYIPVVMTSSDRVESIIDHALNVDADIIIWGMS